MTFIQVIDRRTRQAGEVDRLVDDWGRATEGKRTATHSVVARDRSDSAHVVEIAEFSSCDPGLARAKEGNREILEAFRPVVTVEDLVAEGDRVCVRLSWAGRHPGPHQGLEPTGREIRGTGHATFRCVAGKIAESWWNRDDLGVLRQIGAVGT